MHLTKKNKEWVIWIIVCAIVTISILPMVWLFIGSVKTAAELWAYPPKFIPENPSLQNFIKILTGSESRLPFLRNSFTTAVFSTILVLILAVPASYKFAHLNTEKSGNLEFWILSTRMMPQIASLIPLFIVIRKIGLFDTHIGLILVYTMFNVSYAVWMLTIFFRRIPFQIEEAAFIDGCSPGQVFRKIAIPLIAPSILTVAAFVFMFSWNELIFALILTGNVSKTLPVAISEYTNGNFYRWELITAAATVQVIPAILVVVSLQKYIVSGLTMGAVKQ